MFIVVGLGNPGREYAQSRHNVGFHTVDLLARQLDVGIEKRAHKALLGEARIGMERIVIAKPQTYMNLSGMSVLDLMNWYKCEHNQLIVIYDDADLDPGKLRIRERGSAGTHNGMRSIIYQLGYDDFPRVRIGIGKAPSGWDLADHVLGRPKDEEAESINAAMQSACEAVALIVAGDIAKAQAQFN